MLSQVVKYVLEGLAVAFASHLVAGNKLNVKEVAVLGLTAAAVFMSLELYAPSVAAGARQGAGFGLGAKMVGGGDIVDQLVSDVLNDNEDEASDNAMSVPYKLVDGMYSHKVLLAGFNENAEAANEKDNCKNASPVA